MGNQPEDQDVVGDLVTVRYLRNFPFPDSIYFNQEDIESALDYNHHDGDIIVSTFPKTGTTWLEYIVWQILHKGESFPSFDDLTHRLVPFMEVAGTKAVDKLPPPRFYKNHFPYNMMSINAKAKYLYIHRDPKDTVVSYFHFHNTIIPRHIPFETFFEAFMTGKVAYGDYFDHVLSFYPHRNDDNVLFLSYEEMHKDTRSQILRIAKFLGEEYYEMLQENEELLAHILKVTSFDYMKKNLFLTPPGVVKANGPMSEQDKPESEERKVNFFRKGIVGDGKTIFTNEQTERIRKKILEKMEGTELAELWTS